MEWTQLRDLGLPGAMIAALVYLGRLAIQTVERLYNERTKVEDKKAEAMVGALASLANKVDAHALTDIQSHRSLGEAIAEIRGKLDEVIVRREAPTPVRGIPTYRKPTGGNRDD